MNASVNTSRIDSRRGRVTGTACVALLAALALGIAPAAARAQHDARHAGAVAGPTPSQPLSVELRAATSALTPGTSADIAVRIRPEPEWHTYWRYSGDVGAGNSFAWTLPAGYAASALRWPTPMLMRSGPLASYGYKDEFQILGSIHVPVDARIGSQATVAGTLTWVACRVECVAGEAHVALTLPVATTARVDSAMLREFAADDARVPTAGHDWSFRSAVEGAALVLRVQPPASSGITADVDLSRVHFFVDSADVIDHAAPVEARAVGDALELRLVRSAYASGPPSTVTGVLTLTGRGSDVQTLAVDVNAPVVSLAQLAVDDATAGLPGGWTALLSAGLLALLGGTLLNLMPCVLPVLSIKAMGIAEAAGQDARSARRHTLLFGAGVLVSMWALVGTLLALRAAGAELGWGFQLQSPAVVGTLALIVFAAAMNMAGLFEVSAVGGSAAVAAGRQTPATEAFLSGVLVTALATPCSAPFLATAVAFGIASGALSAIIVFTALGLGLVWPLALVAAVPRVRRWLPKPGPWMTTLRQALAFPLLVTVVWLAWVLGRQAGVGAVTALLTALTVLAFGLWALGHFGTILASPRRRRAAQGVAIAAAAVAIALVSVGTAAPMSSATAAGGRDGAAAAGISPTWQPYTATALDDLRASGRIVLVEFTADWCLTCKLNERVAFGSDDVQAALRANDVALLRADWTTRDPAITRALAVFGRNSVPFVVIYPRDPSAAPTILPTLLTPGIVTRALDEVASRGPAVPSVARNDLVIR